jgi:hypothetical protein
MSANDTTIKWDTLSAADISVLKSLGIERPESKKKIYAPKSHNPITVARRLSTMNTAPDPYYVKINDRCSCCHSKGVRIGKMGKKKLSDNFLSLIIQEIPEGEIYRTLQITSVTCVSCEEVLGSKTHEELVQIIKTLHGIAATKCLP